MSQSQTLGSAAHVRLGGDIWTQAVTVNDALDFFPDQGTEKAEDSGENEGQDENREDAGNPPEAQQNVSACFWRSGYFAFRPVLSFLGF